MIPALGRRDLLAGAAAASLVRPSLVSGQGTSEVVVTLPRRVEVPLAERQARVVFDIDVPTKPFSPFDATAEELAQFGLPPRPDAGEPGILAWRSLVEGWRNARVELVDTPPADPDDGIVSVACPAIPAYPADRPPQASRSHNWSGAYLRAIEPSRFRRVTGQWRIPDACLPQGSASAREFRTSQWVGFDGTDPTSRSLPQLGSIWRRKQNGEITKRLWWQWWIRGAEKQEVNFINDFPVAPGDFISCTLTVDDPRAVRYVVVKNLGASPIALCFLATNQGLFPPDPMTILDVEGRVAEWVVERPKRFEKKPKKDWLYSLPAFERIPFTNCSAIVNDASSTVRTLERARLLRITDWDDDALPGRSAARVWNLNASGFDVYYTGPPPS
jgi:hypothetical protein